MISQKIRGLFKNFYFLFFLCFVLWMTIIDSNGFINRYRLSDKLSELNSQKEFYVKEIDKVLPPAPAQKSTIVHLLLAFTRLAIN